MSLRDIERRIERLERIVGEKSSHPTLAAGDAWFVEFSKGARRLPLEKRFQNLIIRSARNQADGGPIYWASCLGKTHYSPFRIDGKLLSFAEWVRAAAEGDDRALDLINAGKIGRERIRLSARAYIETQGCTR